MRGLLTALRRRMRRVAMRQENVDSGFESMFNPRRRAAIGDEPTSHTATANIPAGARSVRRASARLTRVESALADASALALRLPGICSVTVTGAATNRYSSSVWAHCEDPERANAIGRRADLREDGDALALVVADDLLSHDIEFHWDIVGPNNRPVTIRSEDATVAVHGIGERVAIAAGHGMISVLESSGPVDIHATPKGRAVWAGRSGPVRIEAEFDVYLKVTERTFEGTLDARSLQLLRLWVPRGFEGAIEVNVRDYFALECRAELGPRQRREEEGRVIFSYGTGTPHLRLTSERGRIIIDHSTPDGRAC